MLTRRAVLGAGAALLTAPLCRAAKSSEGALYDSALVYITPLHASGKESTCHAEVWFVYFEGAIYVVTASDAWRARAVRAGLDRARLWVGEFGVWTRSDGAYRSAPQIEARAELPDDALLQTRVLAEFGKKYSREWQVWGPRFRNGLADGSRVMIRYRPIG